MGNNLSNNNIHGDWTIDSISYDSSNPFSTGSLGEAFAGTHTSGRKFYVKKLRFGDQKCTNTFKENVLLLQKLDEESNPPKDGGYYIIIQNSDFSSINSEYHEKHIYLFFAQLLNIFAYFTKRDIIKRFENYTFYLFLENIEINEAEDKMSSDEKYKKLKVINKNLKNEDFAPEWIKYKLNSRDNETTQDSFFHQFPQEVNFYKVLVFNVALIILELLGLNIFHQGLKTQNPTEVDNEILDGLSNIQKKLIEKGFDSNFGELIKLMLLPDPKNRPDFLDLKFILINLDRIQYQNMPTFSKALVNHDKICQNEIGSLFLNPKFTGEKKNLDKAFEWFSKSALKEYPEGLYNIANMFYKGWGTQKDYTSSFSIYNRLFKDYPESKAMVGLMYAQGKGTNKNVELGLKLLEEAAEQHCTLAYNNLGIYYQYHVKDSCSKAVEYYRKAAIEGNNYARANFGYLAATIYANDENFVKEALNYLLAAIAKGNEEAKCHLALIYLKGIFLEKNYNKAFELYLSSAEDGYYPALINIGFCYLRGFGVKVEPYKAIEYFVKAGDNGYPDGYAKAAYLYYTGIEINQDFLKAKNLYEKACEYGSALYKKDFDAMYQLGVGLAAKLENSKFENKEEDDIGKIRPFDIEFFI